VSANSGGLLGELSYPIYICHLTVIAVVGYFWNNAFSAIPYDYHRLVMTGATVAAAVVLYILVQRPTDALRKWLSVARAQTPRSAPMQPRASVDQVVRV
jgi:peptidoglycan/LPS O-acetylase OafA/YrhL